MVLLNRWWYYGRLTYGWRPFDHVADGRLTFGWRPLYLYHFSYPEVTYHTASVTFAESRGRATSLGGWIFHNPSLSERSERRLGIFAGRQWTDCQPQRGWMHLWCVIRQFTIICSGLWRFVRNLFMIMEILKIPDHTLSEIFWFIVFLWIFSFCFGL